MDTLTALLIPVDGPIETVTLDGTLDQLQSLVGGMIEAVPLPAAIDGAEFTTSYVNEEGKITDPPLPINWRATDYMIPGIGIMWGDTINGPFLLCGFDPSTGDHAPLHDPVIARARLIESESSR